MDSSNKGWSSTRIIAIGLAASCISALALTYFAPISAIYFLALGGLFAVAFGWKRLTRAKATVSWVPVNGRVSKSRIAQAWDYTRDQRLFNVEVKYEYEYCSKLYVSQGWKASSSDEKVESRELAEQMLIQFPPNADVTVFVNPEFFSESVLEPGISERTLAHLRGMIGSGIVVAVVAVILIAII